MNRLLLSLAVTGTLSVRALAADPTPEPIHADKPGEVVKKDSDVLPPPVVTDHTMTLADGRMLKYKATAGYLTLRDTTEPKDAPPKPGDKDKSDPLDPLKGKAKAQVFFVAYTLDSAPSDPAARPVTFSFNGGPGSSSVWLHLGALGPRRAQLTDQGEAPPPPYKLVDNESTWLDLTDLVFIDPVLPATAAWSAARAPTSSTGTRKTSPAWANSSGST